MYLLIDPSQKDTIHLALFDEKKRFDKSLDGRNRELLFCIDEFLTKHKLPKEEVLGIAAVVGEGGFTSTRLSVTVANTFSYALQIPVLTVGLEEVTDTQSMIEKLKKQPDGQYISATYSGEPNIGHSK